ncbi:hypothetical protein GCM10023115_20250 [Pontixanthobacter gangjinensis]
MEAVSVHQAQVSSHLHPAFQLDDISGHDLDGRDFLYHSISPDPGDLWDQIAQGPRPRVGLKLLIASDQRIREQDPENEKRVPPVSDSK